MLRRALLSVLLLAAAGGAYYYLRSRPPVDLVLTGIVTTNDVVVSPLIAGQITQLTVAEGDTVKKGQLIAVIASDELKADSAYFAQSAQGLGSQVTESEAALRYQQLQTTDQIRQAESTLASLEAQAAGAAKDLETVRTTFMRVENLSRQGVVSAQDVDQARSALNADQSKLDSLGKQVDAARSAVALARSNAEQVAMRRSQVASSQHQAAAAVAQRQKADVRLGYTELHAQIDGTVDVLAARVGEVVSPGQPVVTLVNPDDLWVRVDVEETYIDRIRTGDKLTVRLPSGVERDGTVFYRGLDASFATQRDVSRTKRDIKTFEVRLRVDNSDRRLALGMTAYVLLPLR